MASLLLGGGSSKSPGPAAGRALRPASAGVPVDSFSDERALALLVIALVALWLRGRDPGFTTAYMDESIYVVYGRMFLARHFEAPLDSPLRWSFGWYLWPILSALADRLGGLIAVRELGAVLGTASVMAIYGFARRLFGSAVGLGSAAVFAVIGPAVMASRIATRDAGAIFFFTFGLWAYARAWQSNERRSWLAAAACLLSAFLCKYVVAIYVPFLAFLALRKGWRAAVAFCLPLGIALVGYLLIYRTELRSLLSYGGSYSSLRASAPQLWEVYVAKRIECWLVAALALLALAVRKHRATTVLCWFGAALALALQWKTRSDFDFWKHAVYPLIFLVPLAVHALLAASQRAGRTLPTQTMIAVPAILMLCGIVAWTGQSLRYDRAAFWPNVEPILSYLEGRLPGNSRILMDDSVFRYYFNPQLAQSQMADPFYFHYKQWQSEAAYQAAVQDGWFDYIVLDGGMGTEAKALQRSIHGHLNRYSLRMEMPDPTLGQTIQVFQRTDSSALVVPANTPSIDITSPSADSLVSRISDVNGRVHGAAVGWTIRTEVFSNRWYPSQQLAVQSDGAFETKATFGGEGQQGCHQMLRVRLFDDLGHPRAVSILFNLKTTGLQCR